MIGIGTAFNATAILIGGALGLLLKSKLSDLTQHRIRLTLACLTVFVAGGMIWQGLGGGFWLTLKRIGLVLVAIMIGAAIGTFLGLQKRLDRIGRYAQERFAATNESAPNRTSEGLVTCTLLFCVGPMAILGSLEDGLEGRWSILALKGMMDGLATLAMASTFGWGVILSVIPLVAYQGTLTLSARLIKPYIEQPELLLTLNLTGGLLILCIVLVILRVQKVPLADYLPALAIAPLLTRWLA
ncbi:MAG: DUF554 domain-containing protein [Pedosphaera sp.]|nr:DUF554 domain-containing protein [Pedosphaera sp.]